MDGELEIDESDITWLGKEYATVGSMLEGLLGIMTWLSACTVGPASPVRNCWLCPMSGGAMTPVWRY